MDETKYTETEALMAVMNDDHKYAQELLDGMTAYELKALGKNLDTLWGIIKYVLKKKTE